MVKVSVVMITYNHEKYITAAIDGVLMQNCNFPIELIIANDHSHDNTDAIILNYIKNHPKGNIIRYFHHEQNTGMMPNFLFALKQAKAEYIAVCESDDYWTDCNKLQKQVDFMEADSSYGLCFTDFDVYYETKNKLKKSVSSSREIPTGYVLKKIIYNNPYTTCTVMFKRKALYGYNEIAEKNSFKIGDWGLWLHIARKYKVGYIKNSTACYRVLDNSAQHFDEYKNFYEFFVTNVTKMRRFYCNKYALKINPVKIKIWNIRIVADYIVKNKKYLSFFQHLFKISSAAK
jgi:glycosyltransferase involved in cell wall biosynthesis